MTMGQGSFHTKLFPKLLSFFKILKYPCGINTIDYSDNSLNVFMFSYLDNHFKNFGD